jgi:prophage DNA circulation protein
LIEKIQAIRGASDRFERAVQFCSYEHIISTRLDIREHQRLSRENYQELLREFELLEQQSMDQSSALRGTISDEAAAMRQIIGYLINRVSGLETAISGFVNSSASIPASIGSRSIYSSPLSLSNTKQLCFPDSHYQAQAKFG